ncbi:nephronectin [Leuresthes tenuis]|uniref:nephronectin n=1 Tax=Leuresthes tenuis TaxID=355514 RepID=UPI003B50DDE8
MLSLVLVSWFCLLTRCQHLDYDSWADQALSDGLCRYGNSVECCWGWTQMDRGRCQPHCQQGCKHGQCVGPDRCKCHPGYAGKACNQDLNECGLKPRPCKHRCMNTPGSYKCYCLDGYMLQPDGSCRNVRTCYHANCQYGCEVIKGEVRCTCPSPGLRLGPDRRTCVDVDECASGGGVCPRRRKCVNTFGSFICKCHLGFRLVYINGRYTCIDKDTRPFCVLNPFSPKCRCKDGGCKVIPKVILEPQRPRTPTSISTAATTAATTAAPATPAAATTTTTAPATPAAPPATTTAPATPAAPPATTTAPATPAAPPATTTAPATPAAPPATTTAITTRSLSPPTDPTTTTTKITSAVPATTTAAPSTAAPSTAAPTTSAAPSTAAPSTAAPTTAAPSTAAPSTAAPSTASPSTAAPTTAAPTTAAPTTTAAPSTAAPSTAAPTTTAAPSTAAPSTAAPSTAAPTTTAAPSTAAPSTAAPSTALPPTTETETPPPPTTAATTMFTVALTTTMLPTTSMVTTTVSNRINKDVTHKQRGDVHIPRQPGHNQVWEFDIELGNTAEDARDDPEVGVLHCTFLHGICDWMSEREGDLHWQTVHTPAGEQYLSVPELKTGQRSVRGARLAVQIGPPWSHGDLCFSFSHWLTGHHVGVLQLFVRNKGRDQRYGPALWSRTGGHGWRQTQVTLTTHSVDRVLLKVERRKGQKGQIAVDDVTLRKGACR